MEAVLKEANIQRTRLLWLINNEIPSFKKCKTKVNSISFTEQVSKFNSIEITFHNPLETGNINTQVVNQSFETYNSNPDRSFNTVTDNSTPNSEYISLGCLADTFKLKRKLCSRRKWSNLPYDEIIARNLMNDNITNTLLNSPTEEQEREKQNGENNEEDFRSNLSWLREWASTFIKRKKKVRKGKENKSTKVISTGFKESISSWVANEAANNKYLIGLASVSPKQRKKHKTVGLSNPPSWNLKHTQSLRLPLKSVDSDDKYVSGNIFTCFKLNPHHLNRRNVYEENWAIEENEEDYKKSNYPNASKTGSLITLTEYNH